MEVYVEDLETPSKYGQGTPLFFAVALEHEEKVAWLLSKGCNVHARNKFGETALHWAAHRGLLRTVELLLQSGASIHHRDNEGLTPCDWSIGEEHYHLFPLLNPNAPSHIKAKDT